MLNRSDTMWKCKEKEAELSCCGGLERRLALVDYDKPTGRLREAIATLQNTKPRHAIKESTATANRLARACIYPV
jgi:hypothetical protein